MLPEKLTIADDFPAVGYDQWRELVEQDLQGASFERKLVTHTYEGIAIQPVYTRRDQPANGDASGLPGLAPLTRGSTAAGSAPTGWDLRQEHADPDPHAANRAILDDLIGGVTSIQVRLDAAGRSGRDASDPGAADLVGLDGIAIASVDDLDRVLQDVHLDMAGVALEAGAGSVPAAALLAAVWRRRGLDPSACRGAFYADPLGTLAREGVLPQAVADAVAQAADLARWTSGQFPHVRALGVDTGPYHDAGATAAQDIAFAAATGLAYLRAMESAGVSLATAARQLVFRMSVGTHHFLAIAKLRAVRRVWSRVVEACGVEPATAGMYLHVRTSRRVLTRRAPYVNLLRNTTGVFAAALGGAQSITSAPFDQLVGLPTEMSRRIARNTVLVLQEEAGLHRVIDPAGGSWFLECLTDQLAEKGWEILQEIESRGGMAEVVTSGWCAETIDAAYAPRSVDIARRKQGITGVSEFPEIDEERLVAPLPDRAEVLRSAQQRAATHAAAEVPASLGTGDDCLEGLVAAAGQGASLGQLAAALGIREGAAATATPLELRSFAEPYEHLRDASDAWLAEHGLRPRVFLANLGSAAHFTARASYAKNFFEAGGFEAIDGNGAADADALAAEFAASGAKIAVLCSSDKLYEAWGAGAAAQLQAAGARSIVLAGRPGEGEAAYREAGVDRFIFMGCNVLETLQEMLHEEGVTLS